MIWGMIFCGEGKRPDPENVEALEYIAAPTSKEELLNALCMMQSNDNFISNFAQNLFHYEISRAFQVSKNDMLVLFLTVKSQSLCSQMLT